MTTESLPDSAQLHTGMSLRWQICIFTGIAVLVSLLGMGYVAFSQSSEVVTEITLDQLADSTRSAVEILDSRLQVNRADLIQTPQFPPIPGILRSEDNQDAPGIDPRDGSTKEIWIQRLTVIIKAQMSVHAERAYSQVLDGQGREIMRVERTPAGLQERVPEAAAAATHADAMFRQTAVLQAGEFYVAPMATGYEGWRALLRMATPYFDEQDQFRGIFVIALDGEELLQQAAEKINRGSTDIVDQTGRYLYSDANPESVLTESRYVDAMPVRGRLLLAGADSPDEFRQLIPGADRGGDDMIAIYQKLHYDPQDTTRFWAVAPSISAATALQPISNLARKFALLGLIVILVVGIVASLASKALTGSLTELAAAADEVASGNLEAQIPHVRASGEVGVLTESLRAMNARLQAALGDARESENRTRAILDSTADAIVTLNQQGHIQSVNAAAVRMFQYSVDELKGQDATVLVPALTSKGAKFDAAPLRPGEVRLLGGESQVTGHRKDGTRFAVAMRVTEMEFAGERLFISTLQDVTDRQQAARERNRLFAGIREAVERLAASSSEILATTSQQASSAQQQAASVSQTVTTVEELTQSADETSQRANEVAESANQADEVAHSGRQAIESTFDSMERVRAQVESTAQNIVALAERAQAIGEIITTVNDIADQTNLLALNAAIEASRAGEHGKGFAVVADEVKALAEQSKAATDQVRRILGEIQQATNTAVISTEQGTRSVADAQQVISEAEATIETLFNTIGESARSASQIRAAAGQQAIAMRQISDAMLQIDSGTRQTLSATRQSEQSARDLNELGKQLKQLTFSQNDEETNAD